MTTKSAATTTAGSTPVPATIPTVTTILAPATFAELMEFAQMAARSQLVPPDYRHHPEDILLAIQLGSEVGLRPMQALQNIAVINGRPAVWGDALPGICKASSVFQDLIETWEHEDNPDLLTAVCVAKRHGATPVTARFSVADAKRAGLWTKPGPWRTYPNRMLQMRARSFALRDAFPDLLKGLATVEEALDLRPGRPRSPTLDGAVEPSQPEPRATTTSPAAATSSYPFTTRQGTTLFRTSDEWVNAWAKLVRGCQAANALDKLEIARTTNRDNFAAITAFDPTTVRMLNNELERALAPATPA
jgi:hypothetical protein